LVGLSFAKSLAYVHKKPFIGVNHLEGHLNAAFLEHDEIEYPHIGLVVSGGHTSLYLVKAFGKYKLLGATRDDAAGEAFDKVAKILGLGYPGGPIIDKISKNGNKSAFKFTRPKINKGTAFDVGDLDFSFSGLKTAVMLEFKKIANPSGQAADLAASFQATVVDIICTQIIKACDLCKCKSVVISGGVAANSALRTELGRTCQENNIRLFLPSLKFCTDNAAMIGYVGAKYLEMGKKDDVNINAIANQEIGI
jgi:N6-L-threonylcarbamoyladenine synthase